MMHHLQLEGSSGSILEETPLFEDVFLECG